MADGYISYSPSTLVLTWEEVADGFQTADFVSPGLGNLHLEKACLLVKIEQKTFHFITSVRMEQWE